MAFYHLLPSFGQRALFFEMVVVLVSNITCCFESFYHAVTFICWLMFQLMILPICYGAIPFEYSPSVLILHSFAIIRAFQGLYLCGIASFWFYSTFKLFETDALKLSILVGLLHFMIVVTVFADADAYKGYGVTLRQTWLRFYPCCGSIILIQVSHISTTNKGSMWLTL